MSERKSLFLGKPYGTACNQLRKLILFSLLVKHGGNICFRCDGAIENVRDLSIEHKAAWLGAALFWDLENIAFSHLSCNSAHKSHDDPTRLAKWNKANTKKVGQSGTSWCTGCKDFHTASAFTLNKSGRDGLQTECRDYRSNKRSPQGEVA